MVDPLERWMETEESPPVFTPEVLNAWDEIVRRNVEEIPVEPQGQPDSVKDFKQRLAPFQVAIKKPLELLLETVPAYRDLQVYNLTRFWNPKGEKAFFQSHIRIMVAPKGNKTLGRLQLTLCPGRIVRIEYVANIATEPNREFQIEHISKWLQKSEWFSEFQRGCLDLGYYGFKLQCTCGNGESIDTAFPDLTEKQWESLHLYGLDCSKYFVIKYDRPLFTIRELSVDGLAQLAVSDWSELSGLYPFLQGGAKAIGTGTSVAVSDTVERVRRNATPPRPGTFTPEFVGKKAEYEIKGAIQPESNHGGVVIALCEKLKQLGYVVTSDQQRDACIVGDNGEVAVLFEAKTDLVPYSVYTAVGQLMFHGAIQNPPPKRVFVSPEEPEQGTRMILERLGISVITYEIQDDEVQFTCIENIGLMK